jgi:predicted dehydrogenase
MAHSVRIGIIGCGSVMQDGYLPIARDLQARGARRRRVVCDSDPGRAALLQMPGQPTFTTDDHAVLADGAVELVLPPPASHVSIAAARCGLGSRLHRAQDGSWVACAQWHSRRAAPGS